MLLGKLESVYTEHKAAGITYVCSGIPCQSSAAILHHRMVACFREIFERYYLCVYSFPYLAYLTKPGETS